MGFDVVSAVVARPFSGGGAGTGAVSAAWAAVASQHEEEIADRMLAHAVAGKHRRALPVTRRAIGQSAVKPGSMATKALSFLTRVSGAPVGEIAQVIGVERIELVSWTTVDMQVRGLVKRSAGQGAGVFVMITDKGRDVLAACERLERRA